MKQHRPIRVCYLIDRLLPGGTESQLLALIQHLDRRAVQPYLCLLDGEDSVSRALEPKSCPVLRLGVQSLRRFGTMTKAWHLARFLKRERIQVLQVFFPDSTYFGIPVARLAGVPFVVRTRNNLGHWLTPMHHRLGRICNRLVTATLTNCEAARRSLILAEKAPPRSIWILENGVDLERFLSIPPPGTASGPVVVIAAVANLRPVKGLDVLIQAAALLHRDHPAARFRIAGEGDQRPALEQLVRSLGLAGRVELAGSVADVPAFLASADVAVLPSRAEGMSNALLEYMAAARPIVATAVGATPQLIEDGRHGLLVPADDPATLAAAISRLLREPALASRLAANARQRVRERFSRRAMVQRFEAFYRGLAEGKQHAS